MSQPGVCVGRYRAERGAQRVRTAGPGAGPINFVLRDARRGGLSPGELDFTRGFLRGCRWRSSGRPSRSDAGYRPRSQLRKRLFGLVQAQWL